MVPEIENQNLQPANIIPSVVSYKIEMKKPNHLLNSKSQENIID